MKTWRVRWEDLRGEKSLFETTSKLYYDDFMRGLLMKPGVNILFHGEVVGGSYL